MNATNVSGATGNKYDVADHLFFKLQGATPASIDDAAEIVQEIVKKHGGSKFKRAKTQEEGDLIWKDRKDALFTSLAYAGGDAKGWLTDVWYTASPFSCEGVTDEYREVSLFRTSHSS